MRHIPTKLMTAWNFVKFKLFPTQASALDATSYWESRYRAGGNSGAGSWEKAARYKADIVNHVIKTHNVASVIEFGCGDGNQLSLYQIPSYTGFDVSQAAIDRCSKIFHEDSGKNFFLAEKYADQKASASISIDVIYHIIDDYQFDLYMKNLFNSSTSLVLIYSTNTDLQGAVQAPHVRHRKFSDWIASNAPEWKESEIASTHKDFRNKTSQHDARFFLYLKAN